ncbi:MAG: hypothetical protein P8046_05475 [Anaerolineales bacterium]
MRTKEPVSAQFSAGKNLPYPPSFIDRFIWFIQRLPIPYWLTYLLLFTLQGALNLVLGWLDGWVPAYTFNSLMFLFPIWQWIPLAAITYLNNISATTLSSFHPLLDVDEDTYQQLKDEFTTMPRRGVILSGMIWVAIYVLITTLTFDTFYIGYGLGITLMWFVILEGLIAFITGGVIYYHSIRQLQLVNRTVKQVKRFNLFHLDPVYAFSQLTARTGILWMLLLGLTLLAFPLDLASLLTIAMLVGQVVLALAAFVLPLRSVNQRLVSEKRSLLAANQQRIETTLTQLHQRIDQKDTGEIGQINDALAGLNTERDILAKISTLPFSTNTLRGFLSAIVLPIALLLVQISIQKWLDG